MITKSSLSVSNPIYETLFRGDTPVHYYPPAQKLPPQGVPALPYPGTPIFEFSPQFAPSESFDQHSTRQYQPLVKPTSISSIYPDIYQGYKEDASYQYPYNSAYQQNNYFRASPPYQPDYSNYESQQNYQNIYLGSNSYSRTNFL